MCLILVNLLDFYLAILCNWHFQIVVISRNKNSSVYLRDFTDFFYTDVFPSINACLLSRWRKVYGVI